MQTSFVVSNDTRTIQPGQFYVPVKGENFDGHDFIPQALEKGAAGVIELHELCEMVREKTREAGAKIIAITGSVGKTTTKELVTHVLKGKFSVFPSRGNRNTLIGLAIDIWNEYTEEDFIVAEMGTEKLGEICETCKAVNPRISVVTNIGVSHLEKLGSQENIAKAKAEIFTCLMPQEIALINADDEPSSHLFNYGSCRKLTYGYKKFGSDIYAKHVKIDAFTTSFDLYTSRGLVTELVIPVGGEHMVYAGLIAGYIGLKYGLSSNQLREQFGSFSAPENRLALKSWRNGAVAIDDSYNAAPASMMLALDVLARQPQRHKSAFLGDMLELGSAEEDSHRRVLEQLSSMDLHHVVLVGTRFRKAAELLGLNYPTFDTSEEAQKYIATLRMTSEDVVLVKGSRGMWMEKLL